MNYLKKLLPSIVLMFFFVEIGHAQEKVFGIDDIPVPYGQGIGPEDYSLNGLVWNKFNTKNFTILSLDENQGKYLRDNIEQMKSWTLTRWGLPNVDFFVECKVLCVPNKNMMNKLFRLNSSYAEKKKDVWALWIVLDGNPTETVPSALTVVALGELQQSLTNFGSKAEISFWSKRGMGVLNGTIRQIKNDFYPLADQLQQDKKMHFGGVIRVTEEEWTKKSREDQILFDRESAILCLLIRKEYGHNKLIMSIGTKGDDLFQVLGISGFEEFNSIMKRYMYYLSKDIQQGKCPDKYLQISSASNK